MSLVCNSNYEHFEVTNSSVNETTYLDKTYVLYVDVSLVWPDPLCTGTYQLEIISAALQGSGTVHSTKFLTLNDNCVASYAPTEQKERWIFTHLSRRKRGARICKKANSEF